MVSLAAKSRNPRTPPGSAAPDRSRASAAGMAAGVSASLVWGSAFLIPVLLGGWNPVIVTLGRYLVYGLLSAILFILGGGGPRRVLREHWRTALAFALAGNAAYYLMLVIGIRAAGAPLTDMVIGAIPVVVAVTGNALAPAGDRVLWRRLALAGLPAAALAGQLTTPSGAHPGPARLAAGVVFLGVVVSWAGTWLWNMASSRLSPAVAGLLVNLETVSGFGYVYAARQHWPAAGQLAGLVLVMAGVSLTLSASRSGLLPSRFATFGTCWSPASRHAAT